MFPFPKHLKHLISQSRVGLDSNLPLLRFGLHVKEDEVELV